MKILFVVNEASFFLSHRLPIAEEASRRGCDVMVACGKDTGEQKLDELNIRYRTLPLSRSGINPLEELRTFRTLLRIYREERPDLVHHITIKPVLYGTQAARWSKVPAVVNAVPGMGFIFTRRGQVAAIRRSFVNLLYRAALSHSNMRVIFQNIEDMRGFLGHAIIARHQAALIRGAGVDLNLFRSTPEPTGPITFVLIARMLRDKGVREFVKAAEFVREQYPDWRFRLVGKVDPGNPSSLSSEEINAWQASGVVEWLGQRDDVEVLIADAHVVCLPSYGGEGLPKVLLEGAASGRAIIASDVPGCREIVRDEVTGIMVPPRDAESLAEAMVRLGKDPPLRARIGRAARQKAEAVFSVEDVVRDTFLVYEQLLVL
ncbi:MAG: glycosyltransferase family 4 protein [Gammaproteobacteria bacterium]|nr:glycosyltransferase family 4 protein [Gammaproteobacteria bacterium]